MEDNDKQEKQEQQAAGAADVLSSLSPVAPQAVAGADAARIAELERELQQERVEKGRLRQTNDELRQAREEIARLKAENARYATRNPGDFLSNDEKELIDEGQLNAIDKLVQGRVSEVKSAADAENARLREALRQRDEREAADRQTQFSAAVESIAPGLAALVDGHGEAWKKWAGDKRRAASVAQAFQTRDAETVAEFLKEFVETNGIQATGGGVAARPPTTYSPRGGNRPAERAGDTTVYTLDEFNAAMRRASEEYDAGRMSLEDYRALKEKFNVALREGRVTPR